MVCGVQTVGVTSPTPGCHPIDGWPPLPGVLCRRRRWMLLPTRRRRRAMRIDTGLWPSHPERTESCRVVLQRNFHFSCRSFLLHPSPLHLFCFSSFYIFVCFIHGEHLMTTLISSFQKFLTQKLVLMIFDQHNYYDLPDQNLSNIYWFAVIVTVTYPKFVTFTSMLLSFFYSSSVFFLFQIYDFGYFCVHVFIHLCNNVGCLFIMALFMFYENILNCL